MQWWRSVGSTHTAFATECFLDDIARSYGAQGPAQRHARAMLLRLENASIDDLFRSGLHEFVTEFIHDNNRLCVLLAEQYMLN